MKLNNQSSVGRPCPKCRQLITQSVVDKFKQGKVNNAKRSLALARKHGLKAGRKKIRDDDEIKALRRKGHSMRAIAKLIGMSTMAVQRGLKT